MLPRISNKTKRRIVMAKVVSLGDFALKREQEDAQQKLADFFRSSGYRQCVWELKAALHDDATGFVFTNIQADHIVEMLSYKFKITQAELDQFATSTNKDIRGGNSIRTNVVTFKQHIKQGCDEDFLYKLTAATENNLFEKSDALQMIREMIHYYPRTRAVIWKRK